MATTISKLAILLSLNSQGVTSGLAQAGASVKAFEGKLKGVGAGFLDDLKGNISGQLGSIFTATAAIGAATATWHQVLQGVQDTVERIGSQVDMAGWVGIDQADIARIQYVASLSGIAAESVGRGLARMQDFIAEAGKAGSSQANALGQLGLSRESLAGMDASQRFLAIADAIGQIRNNEDQVRLSTEVFGKSGAELIPIFNAGKDAIAAAYQEADRFGLALNQADAERIDEVGDSMDRLAYAIEGAYNALVAEAAPEMITSLQALTDVIVFAKDNSESLYNWWYRLSMPALWPIRALDWLGQVAGLGSEAAESLKETGDAASALGSQKMDVDASLAAFEAERERRKAEEDAAEEAKRSAEEMAREQERVHESLMRRGDTLRESLLTPIEDALVKLAEFDELYAGGAVSYTTRNRAIEAAMEDAREAILRQGPVPKMPAFVDPSAGALREGSVAAFSAERQGQTAIREMLAEQKKANSLTEEQTEQLKRLEDAIKAAGIKVTKNYL